MLMTTHTQHINTLVYAREFFFLGQYVGMSIANGGPGIPFLAEPVYAYLVSGDFSASVVDSTINFIC